MGVLCFSQDRTYIDFRREHDAHFERELKKDSQNEETLKQLKYYNRFTWFWDDRIDFNGLADNYFLELTKFYTSKNNLNVPIPFAKDNLISSVFWEIIGPNEYPEDPYNVYPSAGFTFARNSGIGRIDAIWVNPTDNSNILIGAYGGGLWETKDSGNTWDCLTKNIPTMSVHQIEVKNNVIYLACGFAFTSAKNFSAVSFGDTHGLGVIKSSDWGNTWQISDTNFDCRAFDISTSNPNIIYAISPRNVYKSIDGGNTWPYTTQIYPKQFHEDPELGDVAIHPTNPNKVYLVGKRGNGTAEMVYKSVNGGNNWIPVQYIFDNLSAMPNNTAKGGTFDYNPTNNKLYLGFLYNSSGKKTYIFQTSDWDNWQTHASGTSSRMGFGTYTDVKSNPINNKVYQLGIDLFDRTGGGSSNTSTGISYGKIHDDMRGMAFSTDGNTMFVGHDGGISKSSNNGQTWTNINGDLNLNLSFNMGYYSNNIGPSSIGTISRLYDIGTQDCGWYRNKMDGSPRYATRGYEGSVYTSPHDGRIYFKMGGRTLEYSDNGGQTKENMYYDNTTFKLWTGSGPLIEDPVDKNTIYVDRYGYLLRSYERGTANSWIDVSHPGQISLDYRGTNTHVPHINNNIIYYTSTPIWTTNPMDNVIWKSENQGDSWCNITNNLTGVFQGNLKKITHITSDAYNPDRIWITLGGITDDGAHIFHSSNGGQSWSNITNNLPNLPVNVVEYDENRNILFVGSDYGVYYLNGTTWLEYGNDLPKTVVTSLFIDDLYNEIIVSTFGRGAWKAPLNQCSDVEIYQNTTWNTNKDICGDLIIKRDKQLTINRANIKVKNVILEPGAKLIWNGGELSGQSSLFIGKGAVYSSALLDLNNVTINNYSIFAHQNATISLNGLSLKNSSIDFNDSSFFHFVKTSTIDINSFSKINLNDNFIFGFPSSILLESNFATRFDEISMTGSGNINRSHDDLYIQDENFQNGNFNFIANHEIFAGNDVTNTLPNGNFTSQGDMKLNLVAGESIFMDIGTEITANNFFAYIDPTLAISPTCNEYLPPPNKINNIEENKRKDDESTTEDKFAKQIIIYPNPSSGIFNYQFIENVSFSNNYKISIFDINGNLIDTISSNKLQGNFDLSKRNAGTYSVVFEFNDSKENILVIKK